MLVIHLDLCDLVDRQARRRMERATVLRKNDCHVSGSPLETLPGRMACDSNQHRDQVPKVPNCSMGMLVVFRCCSSR